jgi:hypothetical protein
MSDLIQAAALEGVHRSPQSSADGRLPQLTLTLTRLPVYISVAPASASGLRSPFVRQTCAVIGWPFKRFRV